MASISPSPLNPDVRAIVFVPIVATTSFFMYLSGSSIAISKSVAGAVDSPLTLADRPVTASVFTAAIFLSPPSASRTSDSTLLASWPWPMTSA